MNNERNFIMPLENFSIVIITKRKTKTFYVGHDGHTKKMFFWKG